MPPHHGICPFNAEGIEQLPVISRDMGSQFQDPVENTRASGNDETGRMNIVVGSRPARDDLGRITFTVDELAQVRDGVRACPLLRARVPLLQSGAAIRTAQAAS